MKNTPPVVDDDELAKLFDEIQQFEEFGNKDSPLQIKSSVESFKSKFKHNKVPLTNIRDDEDIILEGDNPLNTMLKRPTKTADIKIDQFLLKNQTIVKVTDLNSDRIYGTSNKKTKEDSAKPHVKFDSVDVYFPYVPYSTQREYITTVLKALASREHAILESPTGTGKTISLLTSCLAYVKKAREKGNYDIKILYMSRTHSQLQQVIKELRKTVYRPRMMIMGSRDHLCVNPTLNNIKGNFKKIRCQHMVKQRTCNYNTNLKSYTSHYILDTIFDIEDLVEVGKRARICPYYYSRGKIDDRDIIFMPYNYLLDKRYRDQNVDLVTDSILIFDEAHNLQSNAEEGASITITAMDLKACVDELETFIVIDKTQNTNHITIKSVLRLFNGIANKIRERGNMMSSKEELEDGKEIFKLFTISKTLNSFTEDSPQEDKGKIKSTKFDTGLTSSNIGVLIDVLKSVETASKSYIYSNNVQLDNLIHVSKLIEFFKSLELLWINYQESLKTLFKEQDITHFRVFYDYADINNIKVSLWCLNPYYTFKSVLGCQPHSIIVTSGTLSPMETFEHELRIPFKFRFQGKHVIDTRKQVITCILSKFDNGIPVDISYKSRNNDNIPMEIGKTIIELAKIVPEGFLVFFTSYYMMSTMMSKWRAAGILNSISQKKKIFSESKEKLEQKVAIDNYIKFHKVGAIFFAVSGGKLSEGIDFSDSMARCVVMVGIPYPNFTDTRVKAKRDYLDKMRPVNKAQNIIIDSNSWYSAKALRCTNQAIGRVIRHQRDFGAIVLLDMRFCNKSVEKGLSEWALNNIKKYENPKGMFKDLRDFYESIQASQYNGINEERIEESIDNYSKRSSVGHIAITHRNSLLIEESEIRPGRIHIDEETSEAIRQEETLAVDKGDNEQRKLSINMRNCKTMSKSKPKEEAQDTLENKITKKVPIESITKSEKKGIVCTICFAEDKEFWTSRCGHLACIDCWKTYIDKKKECFVCRKKIKSKKNLIRLYC